jgi:hypothetical protein
LLHVCIHFLLVVWCGILQAADDLQMHWAAEMGLRLLQERHAHHSSSSSSEGFWGIWIDSLPQHVVTPVEFTAAEVQQLVMPSAVQVRALAGMQYSIEEIVERFGKFQLLHCAVHQLTGCGFSTLYAIQQVVGQHSS